MCRKLHESGSIFLGGNALITGIKINTITSQHNLRRVSHRGWRLSGYSVQRSVRHLGQRGAGLREDHNQEPGNTYQIFYQQGHTSLQGQMPRHGRRMQ